MESHYDLTDLQFEEQFEQCTLDDSLFTHEAHLRLAWIHLGRYGLEKAIDNVRTQLVNYTIAIGESAIYNETVTVAAMKIVYHFKLKGHEENFADFIAVHPSLISNFKGLISRHYRTDIFTSVEAKNAFMEPELLPFDESKGH